MTWKRRSLVLAVALLSTTAVAAGAAPSASFADDVTTVTAGETADITVSLAETDAATVKVGSKQVNYIATVVVEDGNGDGEVVLRYDTSAAGHGGAFAVADDADAVAVESETEFDDGHLLAAGAYDLAVEPGDDGNVSDASDVATLTVEEAPETTTGAETETSTPGRYAGHADDIEDGLVLAPARNQTVTGTVDAEPGTEVVVETKSSGEFLKTDSTTVGEGGQFRAGFDFSDLPNGTEFDVEVRADGESLTSASGVLRSPPTAETTQQPMRDETTEDAGNTTAQPSQDGTVPGFGLAAGALAVAGAVLLGRRRA